MIRVNRQTISSNLYTKYVPFLICVLFGSFLCDRYFCFRRRKKCALSTIGWKYQITFDVNTIKKVCMIFAAHSNYCAIIRKRKRSNQNEKIRALLRPLDFTLLLCLLFSFLLLLRNFVRVWGKFMNVSFRHLTRKTNDEMKWLNGFSADFSFPFFQCRSSLSATRSIACWNFDFGNFELNFSNSPICCFFCVSVSNLFHFGIH